MRMFGSIYFTLDFEKQVTLLTPKQMLSSKTNTNIIPQLLPSPINSTPFKIGQTYQSGKNEDIYFQYAANINIESVMLQSLKRNGFKIFEDTKEKDEIGYIVPSYDATPGCIDIEAVWINKDMRHNNYGTQAVNTFMSLYLSKKNYFPDAKYFAAFVTADREAMISGLLKSVVLIKLSPLKVYACGQIFVDTSSSESLQRRVSNTNYRSKCG